jgi:hypothetical protein
MHIESAAQRSRWITYHQKIATNNEESPVLQPRLIENTPERVGVE